MDRRRYLLCHLALCCLLAGGHALNRFLLAPHAAGPLGAFLRGHLSDLLAGTMILAISAVLMELGQLPRLSLPVGLVILGGACVVWEVLAPLWKPSAVFDWWDMVCYLAGGGGYGLFRWLIRKSRP